MLLRAAIHVAPIMCQRPRKCFEYPLSLVIGCIRRTISNEIFFFTSSEIEALKSKSLV